jgi:hypothetical protein
MLSEVAGSARQRSRDLYHMWKILTKEPHKQKWSYLSSHVQQACHSATTLWNSGKEGKEKGMMGKGMRLRWRNTLVDVLYTYEIQQWNLMPLLEVGQEEDDLERCSGRFNQSTI